MRGKKMKFKIEEEFLLSKTQFQKDCEDRILINENYFAVIDGATSKTEVLWDGYTSGQLAGQFLIESLNSIPPEATAREAVDLTTSKIFDFYGDQYLIEIIKHKPFLKLAVSFIAISKSREEIWLVGDCHGMIDRRYIENKKDIDELLSEVRSLYLESELLMGKTISDLEEKDTGREFIMPLLRRQQLFQNNLNNSYGYSTIDGFPVEDNGIHIIPIPKNAKFVVLASDGYPKLYSTLKATEEYLNHLLKKDPLLFKDYKSTKGKGKDDISFDDRAYLKILIQD